ncbi:MAG: OadG family protein [Candidatus Azobacteroides sp.]|nr:OadG family protein [Candidatus Azobacteroides sp.]
MNYNKRYYYIIIFVLSGLFAGINLQAQRTASLRINEVLVINEDNFLDDYGNKYPWIEIFNSSPGIVNIAGCFLTDDIKEPKKYRVPKGDVLTKIKPHQHVLFWADNHPARGTFHVNFTLYPDKPNFIALFDSDGRTLIDSVTVPSGQSPDISYGLFGDGWTQKRLEEEIRLNPKYKEGQSLWVYFEHVTPASNNKISDASERVDNFKSNDSRGIGMTITAMGVVFLGLIALYLLFKLIGNTAVSLSHKRTMKASGVSAEEARDIAQQSGEIYAAIAMAIFEATEFHDDENTILTIKNTVRNYSPWSSKIYTLRETPKR